MPPTGDAKDGPAREAAGCRPARNRRTRCCAATRRSARRSSARRSCGGSCRWPARWRCATAARRSRSTTWCRSPGSGLVKAVDRLRPEPRAGLRRVRRADDPRRAAPPLPRPRLERPPAPRPAGADDEGRRRDQRPDRGARALPDPDRDRRPARDHGRGRARGARGRARPPDALARRAPAGRRRGRGDARSRRSATPSPATTGSRPRSPRTSAGPRRARVAGAADAVRRRAHPAGDRPPARASRRCRSRASAGGRCGSCSPPSAARTGGPGPGVDEPIGRGRPDPRGRRVHGRCSG